MNRNKQLQNARYYATHATRSTIDDYYTAEYIDEHQARLYERYKLKSALSKQDHDQKSERMFMYMVFASLISFFLLMLFY